MQRERERKKSDMQLGPYIFATCHGDVAQYLQPELICVCAVGKAPRVIRNAHEGIAPESRATLRGNITPPPVNGGDDYLVGQWIVDRRCNEGHSLTAAEVQTDRECDCCGAEISKKDRSHQCKECSYGLCKLCYKMEFSVRRKHAEQKNVFYIQASMSKNKENIRKVDWLRADAAGSSSSTRWFSGAFWSMDLEIRLRLTSQDQLVVQYRKSSKSKWQMELQAVRRPKPTAVDALLLTRDPEEVMRSCQNSRVLHYQDCDLDVLRKYGWYIPPEYGHDQLHKGLQRKGEPVLVSSSEFRFDAKQEATHDNQYYLATYVGESDGSLCPKLQEVSKLLDCPFDGLCVHMVPQLENLGEFSLGVVTGPSGSGKSTLVQKLFGPTPNVTWLDDVAILGHFVSIEVGRKFCDAACLDPCVAMRPFTALSGGEQARAQLARLLEAAVASASSKPLVLEEFSSLVDRDTAKKMAKSVQNLAQDKGLCIVISSCHSDFLGAGMLEPDWIFECHNKRLLHFQPRSDLKQEADLATCPSQEEPNMGCDQEEQLMLAPQPPLIQLEVRRALAREWAHFREHHYKDHKLKGDSVAFVGLIDSRVCCFTAVVPEATQFVHRGANSGLWPEDHGYPIPWMKCEPPRSLYREHRTVVLPDFQGMGLAPLLCDAVANYFVEHGHDFTSQTVHPFYGGYRDRSSFWRALPTNQTEGSALNGNRKFSHFFIGAVQQDGSRNPEIDAKLRERCLLDEW